MIISSLLAFGVAIAYLAILYVIYCAALSSLSCLPIRERERVAGEGPFGHIDYHGAQAQGADRILLLESPVDGLGARLHLFDEAMETIDIVCHTIHPGGTTAAFWDAVRCAADRGVQVRILLDGKASSVRPQSVATLKALAQHPGIQVRRYNPIDPLKPWKWHYLMHDKFIVADGAYLLLGGRNLGDKFFAPDDFEGKISNDRDVLVQRQGAGDSAVDQAAAYFTALWQARETVDTPARRQLDSAQLAAAYASLHGEAVAFRQANPAYTQTPLAAYLAQAMPTRKITLLHNPIQTRRKAPWIWQQLQRIALEARHSVVLQSPYITANLSILDAFSRIAGQKQLRILTNSAASTPNFPAFSNYFAQRRKFVKTGAHIFEYQSRHSIHGKAMVVDGRLGIVGSFNMDDRSMHLDTEIMLVVDSEPFAASLLEAIETYQAQSLRVNEAGGYAAQGSAAQVAAPAYKVPLLRVVSLFSRPLRVFI